MKDKRDLIRVVKNSGGDISLDPTGKKPGRGAYICRSRQCFDAAVKAKRFDKAFGCRVPGEVLESLGSGVELADN